MSDESGNRNFHVKNTHTYYIHVKRQSLSMRDSESKSFSKDLNLFFI